MAVNYQKMLMFIILLQKFMSDPFLKDQSAKTVKKKKIGGA